MPDSPLDPRDFQFIADLLRERAGHQLDAGKEYLVRSRLGPVAERRGFAGLGRLIERLRAGDDPTLAAEAVEAMAITETSFFRDVHPFEILAATVLPRLIEARRARRTLDIWCAACSSGQEPYSIAMLIHEQFPELLGWRVNLLATDLCEQMLRRCRTGRYSQLEIQRGLSPERQARWFRPVGAEWEIDARLRGAVEFRQFNLAHPWPGFGPWDLILLRNVMIYFDAGLKKQVLGRAAAVLRPDGRLLLGGAETTYQLHDGFQREEHGKSGCYRLKSTGG